MGIDPFRPARIHPAGADIDNALPVAVYAKLKALFRTIRDRGVDDPLCLFLKIHGASFLCKLFVI